MLDSARVSCSNIIRLLCERVASEDSEFKFRQ